MGVRLLLRGAVSLPEIISRLDKLGAVRSVTRWRVQCSYMLPRASDSGLRTLFVVQTSEVPLLHLLVFRAREAAAA